ncbi:MAG: heme exporter protein CcmD [Rhodospirillales bacterium]|nr:heme exporter protein CcmD [Rhodospirillales bacterium]
MDVIKEFLDMGGYGGYIWPSYIVTAVVLIVMLVASQRLLKGNEATIKALEPAKKEETGEEKT